MRHCLLVDDNSAFAENVAEILRDEGAEVTVCNSGLDALERAKTKRFDVLVTDMRMPVMNGVVLVHEIRRIDQDLPVIVVSAFAGEADLSEARNEGVLAILPKPVSIPQLLTLAMTARRGGVVVIIEDDVAMADNLSELLRERGITALTVHSSLEMDRLSDVKPFAAIVDLCLPDAPRGEILSRLSKRFPELEPVVITGRLEAMPAKTRHRAVFTKPFDTKHVLGEIDRLYARPQT